MIDDLTFFTKVDGRLYRAEFVPARPPSPGLPFEPQQSAKNDNTRAFREWLETSRELDEMIFSCPKPTESETPMQHSHSTSIDVLDLLSYEEANAFVNRALRYIEENNGQSIEEYELSILVDYSVEPKPVSVEISGCAELNYVEGIEPVANAADAEFWTVYTRRLVGGETLASAETDHRTLSEAVEKARRLAKHYDVPYTGVALTNLDIRGFQHEHA